MIRSLLLLSISLGGLFMLCAPAHAAASDELKPSPQPSWLNERMRFGFTNQMDDKAIDTALHDGLNIICGGTNAGGIGFAGGPFAWDGKNRFYHMLTGEDVDLAPLAARVKKAHAKNLKVIGELMRCWDPQQMNEHPDWQQIETMEGKPGKPGKDWATQIVGCYNSPYGDFLIQKNVELIKRLDWDGQNLDGFGVMVMCYCPYCRKQYKEFSGSEMPPKMDINDPNCRRYMRWRVDTWNQYVAKWMAGLKAVKSDFVFIPWSSSPQRWIVWEFLPQIQGSDLADRLVDSPSVELLWDFAGGMSNPLVPAFTVSLYRGICGERRVWMLPYMRSHAQQIAVTPRLEAEFRMFTILTNGAMPCVPYWALDQQTTASHYADLIKDREPWLKDTRSKKWAAMLVSENSRLFYGISARRGKLGGDSMNSGIDTKDASDVPLEIRRMPAHMESALGVYRAALETHLPLDIITDVDMNNPETLKQYKVLVLPNAACLSDDAVNNIRGFVDAGGGLVAMHESSRCNEIGNERPDFALKDLFQVSFKGVENHAGAPLNYDKPCYLKFGSHAITDDPAVHGECDRELYKILGMDYIGMTTNVELVGKPAVAVERRNFDVQTFKPFLVTSEYGKSAGRVAYFASDIGQSNFTAYYSYERALIANAMKWAARENPPVQVTAPKCVQSTFYEQAKENRMVVHLLNDINTGGNRALPWGDPPLRDEIIPISNVKILFRDAAIKKVTLQPEGKALKIRRANDGVEVTVPELGMYAMVVAER